MKKQVRQSELKKFHETWQKRNCYGTRVVGIK